MKRLVQAVLFLVIALTCNRAYAFIGEDHYEYPQVSSVIAVSVAASTQAEVELSNLLAYWTFDENTGSTANDSAGANNNATLNNTPTWITGKYGAALNFIEANSEYGQVASPPVAGNSSAFSISCWVRTTSAGGELTIYSEGNSGTDTQRFYIVLNDTNAGDVAVGRIDDSGTDGFFLTADLNVNDGNWHHIVYVQRAKNDVEIYVDNVSRATSSTSLGTSTFNRANIGRLERATINNYYDGDLDQLRIYSTALTTTQIGNIYNAGR